MEERTVADQNQNRVLWTIIAVLAIALLAWIVWGATRPPATPGAPNTGVTSNTTGSNVTNAGPSQVTQTQSGATLMYPVGSRFTVMLNSTRNPEADLTCAPEGIIGPIATLPAPQAGYYAVQFRTIASGTCVLKSGDFRATINVM